MTELNDPIRPGVDPEMLRAEFERWYWPVSELQMFCIGLNISKSGRKSELRARVSRALDGEITDVQRPQKKELADKASWKTDELTSETLINEQITFGPNVRGFFKGIIGPKFNCHSDFMNWVRENVGCSLGDAVDAWFILEERKDDPMFRRKIAKCNNFLLYLRNIRDAHSELTLEEAKVCWNAKKIRPAKDGFVIYEPSDLKYLME